MADLDFTKMKVADLKRELKIRGLSLTGNKNELSERLQNSILEGDSVLLDDSVISEDILEDDVLNDDELYEDTKSLLDSNHDEDAVLKSPLSTKSKSPDISPENIQQKKVVLKRKLLPSISTEFGTNNMNKPNTNVENSNENKLSNTSNVTDTKSMSSGDCPDKKVIKLSELSVKERLEMRAKKFGASTITNDALKAARAERFFGSTKSSSSITNDSKSLQNETSVDLLRKRTERFGVSVSKLMNRIENQERLEKRKERFGNKKISTAGKSDEFAEKARLRLERFKPIVM